MSKSAYGTVQSYVNGFVLSVLLTLSAYILVTQGTFSDVTTIILVGILAILQFIVQMLFFFHIGEEKEPRMNLAVLLFSLLVVVIVVAGSIWIMINLDYNHDHSTDRTPEQIDDSIIQDEGFYE